MFCDSTNADLCFWLNNFISKTTTAVVMCCCRCTKVVKHNHKEDFKEEVVCLLQMQEDETEGNNYCLEIKTLWKFMSFHFFWTYKNLPVESSGHYYNHYYTELSLGHGHVMATCV